MALALCIGGALKPADGVFRNEAVAVDAHKPSGEFVLKARERFFEQVLALRSTHRHIFQFRLQENNFRKRYEMNTSALVDRQVTACVRLDLAQHLQSQGHHAACTRQRVEQSALPDRLQQIVDGVHFECFQRICVIGSCKDNGGRCVQFLQMLGEFDPVYFGHANIE